MRSVQAKKSRSTGATNRGSRGPGDRPSVLVLLSGGIDSAAVLAAYLSERHPVSALFVDYGQPARRSERAAAQAIAKHYGAPFKIAKIGMRLPKTQGEFFGRNALLALLGGAAEERRPLIVAAGIHSSSPYYDTTPGFAADMQRVFDGYANGAITLGAPFLAMPKTTVVRFARRHRVPLSLTYSCEVKNAPACGRCPSCADRRVCRVD